MTSLARQVKEFEIAPGARVFVSQRKTRNVVSVEGSIVGGVSHTSNLMAPQLLAELLDAGTSTKSKEEIREGLAGRGITLEFSAAYDRLYFTGSCLPEDLPYLTSTLVECLADAAFPKKEIETARERLRGLLVEERTDTKAQASLALMRRLYNPEHPNYPRTTKERESLLATVTRTDLIALRKQFGSEGLVVAIVGDLSPEITAKVLTKLKRLPKGGAQETRAPKNIRAVSEEEICVPIADKANIDVYFGAPLPLTCTDPRFEAFGIFVDLLGGRGVFSGHLMRTVREREGLTYAIYCIPTGFEHAREGIFRIWATFSPTTFRKAVDITKKEIETFLKTGVTEDAVAVRRGRMLGVYHVGLSTTRGLASALHKIGKEKRPLSYLDEYPKRIESITLEEVREAGKLIPFEKLVVAAAGTFEK